MDKNDWDEASSDLAKWAAKQPDPVAARAAGAHFLYLCARVGKEATRAQRVVLKRKLTPYFEHKESDDMLLSDLIGCSKTICSYMRWKY